MSKPFTFAISHQFAVAVDTFTVAHYLYHVAAEQFAALIVPIAPYHKLHSLPINNHIYLLPLLSHLLFLINLHSLTITIPIAHTLHCLPITPYSLHSHHIDSQQHILYHHYLNLHSTIYFVNHSNNP